MLTKHLFRTALQHADPARRVIAVAKLPPESEELAMLLATDPEPEVRIAAANCCGSLSALAAALENEPDAAVRAVLAAALGTLLCESRDGVRATELLGTAYCTDAMRADVARRAPDEERRRIAIAAIQEEALLVELALTAELAQTRMAAALHVRTASGLRKLADAARDKDRGVARLARQRLDAMESRDDDATEADAILAELEALATRPGPIVTAVIALNRRWQALNLTADQMRLARCDVARQALQARFDREHAGLRARTQFERRLNEWLGRADPPATAGDLEVLRSELAALRAEGHNEPDTSVLSRLEAAEQRLEQWTRALRASAGAEALAIEAEQLAAGTSIDDAKLPERWQALDRSIRTPVLTQRFEAALCEVEQRRLAQIRAVEQETNAARLHLHALMHSAEQALAAGQLQIARAAAEEIKTLRSGAGLLPKPTLQRLSRLLRQLKELEGWESFAQHQARVQLCERADAVGTRALEPQRLAVEVQKLRNEWSALDQQQGSVPKAMWDRFDSACAKAYAPAARHFARAGDSAQRGAAAARGIHRRRHGACADVVGRAARLACDRALAARNRSSLARWQSGQRRSRGVEASRCTAQRRTCRHCAMRYPRLATRRRRGAWR